MKNGMSREDCDALLNYRLNVTDIINARKSEYFSHLSAKLNNLETSSKAYWKILKSFVHGKKVPIIPPLIVNNQIVTDIQIKANLFNSYFSEQCKPIDNNSSLPINPNFLTHKRLSQLHFTLDDVTKVVQSLNSNKAHGHDGISIRMIQLCCPAISKPLYLLFRNSFNSYTLHTAWKKANVILVHKKNDIFYIKSKTHIHIICK